jgi:hypothetical protein
MSFVISKKTYVRVCAYADKGKKIRGKWKTITIKV